MFKAVVGVEVDLENEVETRDLVSVRFLSDGELSCLYEAFSLNEDLPYNPVSTSV